MMRSVNNSLVGGQGLANYMNSPLSNQKTLLDYMNEKAAKKEQNLFTPAINPQVTSIINDKGLYDPKTGSWASSGNQTIALNNLKDRQTYNQIIDDALAKEGITLTSKEKMTLNIDKDGMITVSGINDPAKKEQIEKTLNNALKDAKTGLMMHIESIKAMNGQETPEVLSKWMVYNFLKDETGQSLDDLKLVNGQIIGANEKLQQIIDGKKDCGENNEYVQEIIAKLKSVLASNPSKIPDLKLSIDFQNGSLIDKDVKIGFGPEQLKTWFQEFISGQGKWNITA